MIYYITIYHCFDAYIFTNTIDAINKVFELKGCTPDIEDFELNKYYYKPNTYYLRGAYIYCIDSESPINTIKYFYVPNSSYYSNYPPNVFDTIENTVSYALSMLKPSWINWVFIVNKRINNFKIDKIPITLDELAEFIIKGKNNFARYFLYRYEVGTLYTITNNILS